MARQLAPAAVRRLAALRVQRFAPQQLGAAVVPQMQLATDEACERVLARWGGDLCGFLNALTRGELAQLAVALGVDATGRSFDLRARLWDAGAALERGDSAVSDHVQPRPIILGGHL